MILQRLASAIRHQNWSQIITEILIVVIGIFLGLQVTEWNEERRDKNLEQEYLTRIYEDQKATLVSVQTVIDGFSNRASHVLELLDYLEGTRTLPPEDEAIQNSLCYWYAPTSIELQTSTFDELVSTGQLNLIQDEKLRNLLQKTHNRHKAASFDFEVLSQPVQLKARFLEPFIHWQAARTEEIVTYDDNIGGINCNVDLEGLRQSSQSASIIAQLYRSQLVYRLLRQEQSDMIKQVIQYMDIQSASGGKK